MKILLEIRDDKVDFFMELLKNFSFVKARPLSKDNEELASEIREAVANLKLVREGKLKARPARELLDEI